MNVREALATATAVGLVCAGSALAQGFPSKAVRIVVPFPAGGSFDITARILAQRMGPALGQSVIVENRPGAGTVVATEYVARLPADGYTLLVVGPSFVINPALRSKLPFDPAKDFKAVSQTIALPMAIAVTPSLPVKSLKDLITLAHQRPGEIAYGTSGPGTSHHLIAEQFGLLAKAQFVHTPYQGGAPAAVATVGGHSPMLLVNVAEMSPYIKSGKLRLLAVTSPERDDLAPNVPTMRESGFPELEAANWSGMVIATATPAEAVVRLNAEIVRALNLAEVRELLKSQAMHAMPSTPEQFATLLRTDGARYAKIAREANVKVD
jgi:tripartite-type tricarboxylate transporter receptor subunit TctC